MVRMLESLHPRLLFLRGAGVLWGRRDDAQFPPFLPLMGSKVSAPPLLPIATPPCSQPLRKEMEDLQQKVRPPNLTNLCGGGRVVQVLIFV